MEYSKIKSTRKIIAPKGKELEKLILKTMKNISDIVGATLGPNGRPILIERQDGPEYVTKDGVTVFKSLGMSHPIAHSIMNAARDAATRTNSEAGDGTTTATVLAEAIVRYSNEFINNNPGLGAQNVVRTLERAFKEKIEPYILSKAVQGKNYKESFKLLHSVAKVSANGETDIADAVMEAVELVGDKGNATILELSGPSRYEVETIEGIPIGKGYEESCARYYPAFITDRAGQRCYLETPIFILYDGTISDSGTIVQTMEMVGHKYSENQSSPHNVVLVAHGFSDSVLGDLAINFAHPQTINVFPLLTPQTLVQNSRTHFLHDLQAFTSAKIFNPLTDPLSTATMADFGKNMDYFESYRFRSTIVGNPDTNMLQLRVEELEGQLKNPESLLEKSLLEERIGILTGGIARIKVYGASRGELREKRDRTEDAVCAVRGASEHGVLPGGGRVLLDLASLFFVNGKQKKRAAIESDPYGILLNILVPALEEPLRIMLSNAGKNDTEIQQIITKMHKDKGLVFDMLEMKYVEPFTAGILDSVPAVLEAIRGSLSIASLLGTLGGCVVYPRDEILERQDARETKSFLKDAFSTDERF